MALGSARVTQPAFGGLLEAIEKHYHCIMTKLLEQAINSVRDLPADRQDALAKLLLQFAGVEQAMLELSPEQAASFDQSLAEAERGPFATDEQIRAIWTKHGL